MRDGRGSFSLRRAAGEKWAGVHLFFHMQPSVQEIIQQVETLTTPLAEDEGFELWGVDLLTENGRWVLRVLLDKTNGVTLDDCTRVHRQLSDLLDVHDPIPWRYTLEVSSPGLQRPLFRPSQCHRYMGQSIRLQTKTAQDGKRAFIGPICAVEGNAISVIDQERGVVRVSWTNVARAQIALPLPLPGKQPARKRRKSRRQTR